MSGDRARARRRRRRLGRCGGAAPCGAVRCRARQDAATAVCREPCVCSVQHAGGWGGGGGGKWEGARKGRAWAQRGVIRCARARTSHQQSALLVPPCGQSGDVTQGQPPFKGEDEKLGSRQDSQTDRRHSRMNMLSCSKNIGLG